MASTDLSLRDKALLNDAANGYSGDEMAAKYGIPAAQAVARVRELLGARDVWDDIERRKLLLHSVFQIKENLEATDIDVENPKALEAYLKLVKVLSDLMEKQGKISDAELETVTRAQAKVLLAIVEAGYQHARKLLVEEWGAIVDIKQIDAAFREGMAEQAAQIDE